jgi:orotate phosphoribosyltransferase
MQPHQRQFLELALARQVLRFGEFTLKSGAISPYFFNAGRFDFRRGAGGAGRVLRGGAGGFGASSSTCCSGPPKGHPAGPPRWRRAGRRAARRAAWPSTARKPRRTARRQPDRRALAGRVLIVDDVITAGTAIREALEIIRAPARRPARW